MDRLLVSFHPLPQVPCTLEREREWCAERPPSPPSNTRVCPGGPFLHHVAAGRWVVLTPFSESGPDHPAQGRERAATQLNKTHPIVNYAGPLWTSLLFWGDELAITGGVQAIRPVQFSSVTQSCPTLCNPMNRSTPGLPVHHQLPEFTQTHVHPVGDAIQPSHPLSSPSPPAPNPSQHQSLFQ